jgi:hypothetical protein
MAAIAGELAKTEGGFLEPVPRTSKMRGILFYFLCSKTVKRRVLKKNIIEPGNEMFYFFFH